MAQATIIKQTLTIEKVIGKADSKYGKASIMVPLNGKKEFLGLNDQVDEKAFRVGKTYELELSISKTGKRYVNAIVKEVGGEAPPAKEEKVAEPEVEVVQALDREVRITLMNVGNVAASLCAGDIESFPKAFRLVKKLYKEEGVL